MCVCECVCVYNMCVCVYIICVYVRMCMCVVYVRGVLSGHVECASHEGPSRGDGSVAVRRQKCRRSVCRCHSVRVHMFICLYAHMLIC